MIAIETKYYSPSNSNGGKIKAFIHGRNMKATISSNSSCYSDERLYFLAVKELIKKYNLDFDISKMVFGSTKDGMVFCFPESVIES
jgi:hypothetical protein